MNNIVMIGLAFVFFFGGMYLTRPTDEDIQHCVASSNYSVERCIFEMTR